MAPQTHARPEHHLEETGIKLSIARPLDLSGVHKVALVQNTSLTTNLQEKAISTISRYFPRTAATLDWLQPANLASWGGPMNGQLGRQHLIRELLRITDVAAVVETGTYRGTTTEFFWHLTGKPVYSVESQARFYEYAKRRFTSNPNIHLSLSDSRIFLRRLAHDNSVPKEGVLFYLDAHWGSNLPLKEELSIITQRWRDAIIVIDDFEVPEDAGYGYDTYGNGISLTLDYIPPEVLKTMVAFSPALPSGQETGARRGCTVLAEKEYAVDLLAALPLRRLT